jgi:hypothetical protein
VVCAVCVGAGGAYSLKRHSWSVGHVQVEKESQEVSQQRGLGPSQHSSSARTLDQDAWGWGDAQADGQRGAFLSPCHKMRTARA